MSIPLIYNLKNKKFNIKISFLKIIIYPSIFFLKIFKEIK
jgi:hypothetical protein